jgi:hypothetical protein
MLRRAAATDFDLVAEEIDLLVLECVRQAVLAEIGTILGSFFKFRGHSP